MDKSNPSNGHVEPAISLAMGPVQDMDIDEKPTTNGATTNGKRKASLPNGKSYKDDSGSEDDDDVPLVCVTTAAQKIRAFSNSILAEAQENIGAERIRR